MKDILRELTELELDEVAGGGLFGGVRIINSPVQINESVNQQSAGNNNNNGSGNQLIPLIV